MSPAMTAEEHVAFISAHATRFGHVTPEMLEVLLAHLADVKRDRDAALERLKQLSEEVDRNRAEADRVLGRPVEPNSWEGRDNE